MSNLRTTHTLATLELPAHIHHYIADRLREAGYDHAFDGEMIDMTGIGLVPKNPDDVWPFPRGLQPGERT